MRFLGITILALVVALIGLYLMGRYVTKTTRPATDFALDQTTPQGTLRMFLAAVATKDLDFLGGVSLQTREEWGRVDAAQDTRWRE